MAGDDEEVAGIEGDPIRDRLEPVRFELPLRVEKRSAVFRLDVDTRRAMTFELAPDKWQSVVLTIPPGSTPSSRISVRAGGEFLSSLPAGSSLTGSAGAGAAAPDR